MMNTGSMSIHKPNLLLLVALAVGLGVFASGVVQAAPPMAARAAAAMDSSEKWLQAIGGLDLARKLKEWRPRIRVQKGAEGLNLARPFGKSGPTIQCSSSLPDSAQRSLRAGGGNRIGGRGSNSDLFLFVQKRW